MNKYIYEAPIRTEIKLHIIPNPFCLTMMTDGVAAKNDQVKVRDVSELMLEEN